MNLQYIKEDKCTICGCDVIIKEYIELDVCNKLKYREHCQGGRWEHRMFACGQELSYIPNFNKTTLSDYGKCTNNKEYKMQLQKRKDFINKLKAFIKDTDDNVDDKFKYNVLENIKYLT